MRERMFRVIRRIRPMLSIAVLQASLRRISGDISIRIVSFCGGVRMRLVVAKKRSVDPAVAQALGGVSQGDGFVQAGG